MLFRVQEDKIVNLSIMCNNIMQIGSAKVCLGFPLTLWWRKCYKHAGKTCNGLYEASIKSKESRIILLHG